MKQRTHGLRVDTYTMQMKAKEELKRYPEENRFKATKDWVRRFMRNYGLCLREATHACSKLPTELNQKIINFHRYIIKQQKLIGGPEGKDLLIINADQIPYCRDPQTWKDH